MELYSEKTQKYYQTLSHVFHRLNNVRPYKRTVLGNVEGSDLLIYRPAQEIPKAAHILVAAGFHGNEPAGPLAVMEYMRGVPLRDIQSLNISFLPLVNPTGFEKNQRENVHGDDPNRGFPHILLPEPEDSMSAEGKILYDNRFMIALSAYDGFLSLHENVDDTNASYLFTYENRAKPGDFSCRLRDAQKRYYPMKNGIADDGFPEICMVDGLSFNPPAFNCFEDLLVHDMGIIKVATTETAGGDRLERRTQCNVDIIKAFVRHYKLLQLRM